MYQYTTPVHIFTISVDLELLSELNILYAQKDKLLFRKTKEDIVETTGKIVTVTLSQKETGMFDERFPAQIQLHAKMPNGTALASRTFEVKVHKLLETEI